VQLLPQPADVSARRFRRRALRGAGRHPADDADRDYRGRSWRGRNEVHHWAAAQGASQEGGAIARNEAPLDAEARQARKCGRICARSSHFRTRPAPHLTARPDILP